MTPDLARAKTELRYTTTHPGDRPLTLTRSEAQALAWYIAELESGASMSEAIARVTTRKEIEDVQP